jgi:hypothetical protein
MRHERRGLAGMRETGVAVLAIAVLYATIWPHELGHSAAAFVAGCKANWWQTDTSWFLWGSWGGDIDYDCLHARSGPALGLTEFAGIAVNLLLLAVALIVSRWHRLAWSSHRWILVGFVLWGLANYAEAYSYLVLNTLILKSDMKTVVQESGVSRWLWSGAGVLGAVACARALATPVQSMAAALATRRISRRGWLWLLGLYAAAVGLTMAAARLVLT